MQLREHDRCYRLSFDNGISLEVLKRGSAFEGLGQVQLRRRKLRCAELPIMPLIRTPDGYEVSRLELQDIERGRNAVTITLTPHVSRHGRMEWVCCDGEDRWNVGPWEQPPERDRGGALRLTLQAVNRTLGGLDFVGFSYSYKYRSRKCRIYRIHDRATWELGGSATGSSFWMEGPFNEPHKTFENKSDAFTTSWCRFDGGTVQLQQFLPFFTALQGFTFGFDRQDVLVTAFEAPFHCRSLFQKNAGRNYLVHWHQLCGDLSGCLEFPALQVLCADLPADDLTERANQYCAVREELQRSYAEQCGLVREEVLASGRLAPGQTACLEALQRGLDELARAGCKRVYAPGVIHALGPQQAVAKGAPAESHHEARQRLTRLVEHAHQRDMELAASLEDCCAPWLLACTASEVPQEADAHVEDAVGAELVARALRDRQAAQFLLEYLHRVKRGVGLDALFSESVLSAIGEQFDWALPPVGEKAAQGPQEKGAPDLDENAGEIRSLQGPTVSLVAALQGMGYKCPLAGVNGLAVVPPAGPGYPMLKGREFMYRDSVVEFPYEAIADSNVHPLEAYFRGCANRLCYVAVYDATRGAGGRLAGWWRQEYGAVNRAYHAVREHMESSRLLSDERGVLWTGADAGVRVLWCCKPFQWAVGSEAKVFDVMANKRVELEDGGFPAQGLRVYVVENAAGP